MRKPLAVAAFLAVLLGGGTVAYFLWPVAVERGVSPCFLFLNAHTCDEADSTEVVIDGRTVGTFKRLQSGGELHRIVFEASGTEMTFIFRMMEGVRSLYEARFVREVSPGDMLSASFSTHYDPNAEHEGPQPDATFEALADDVPPKVWCWFMRANRCRDHVLMIAPDNRTLDRAWRRARRLGYHVVQDWRKWRHPESRMRIAPPEGVTVVQAILELDGLDGVEVHLEPEYVY